MKTVGGKKLVQFVILFTVVAIFGYSIVENLYGPFPTDKGFPLKPLWETKLNDNIKQVIVSENGHILARLGYSINSLSPKTGNLLWKYRTDYPIYSTAAYRNTIYVIGKNMVLTLDERTGDEIWQQAIFMGSPSEPEIRYVDDHTLVMVDYSDIYMVNSRTGDLIIPAFKVGKGIADTCVYQEKLYIFNRNISAYDLTNGNFLWEDLSDQYPSNTVCENGIAYFSETPSNVFAYDLEKHSLIWSNAFLLPETGIFDVYNSQNFLFIDGVGEFFIVDKDQGKVLHSSPSAGQTASKTVIGDNLFVFYMHEQAIYSYNIQTWKYKGKLRYSFSTIFGTETDRFLQNGNQLILWKGKRLFLYE